MLLIVESIISLIQSGAEIKGHNKTELLTKTITLREKIKAAPDNKAAKAVKDFLALVLKIIL